MKYTTSGPRVALVGELLLLLHGIVSEMYVPACSINFFFFVKLSCKISLGETSRCDEDTQSKEIKGVNHTVVLRCLIM